MSDEGGSPEGAEIIGSENYVRIGVIALAAVVVLTVITVGAYSYAKKRSGTTVLPGGTTYLGPSEAPQQPPPAQAPQKFTVSESTAWKNYSGSVFPFTFSYPETLEIVAFPKDPSESLGYAWAGNPPQNNIIFRVNNLNTTEPEMAAYISKPKREYVSNWWKQYSGGLKGVKSVEEFTNSKGMRGYKAKFINTADQTPNDDVFFEIPGRPDLMVRFGNGWLDSAVFDRIVDTFSWTGAAAAPTSPPVQNTPAQQ
ncbi:hypothetical protein A2Z33_03820 [Candidatus Gottesmanbacteria bacterium RBG_16_52_11]|uniref:Uncharacterized protein n=1 Tax=Candidatus Gottesmanbacteria bacterium RBG_16_52_11 TaxID=1798374 RepID=A0A1F5YVL7_9BACT|nr:MAG: hypothetical protein A2Z33_03820 [Candidatus Gottesmanbacteria bacterium RBG_16_52_11]